MKKIYLFFIYLLIGISSNAVHIVGGDITVRQLSVNGFEFTLRWFKDCNQPNTFSNNLKVAIFDKVTNSRIDSVTVTLIAVNPMTLGDFCYATNLCVHEGVYRAQKLYLLTPMDIILVIKDVVEIHQL